LQVLASEKIAKNKIDVTRISSAL